MATATEARALTEAYRQAQARRAAIIAALVATYFRSKVVADDPTSIRRWLEIMLPRVMAEHDRTATMAATFGNKLRQVELGSNISKGYSFTPSQGANLEQVERSLRVVGPDAYLKKAREIRELDDKFADATMKQALLREAQDTVAARIAGSVARHVQNGGRQTLIDGVKDDPVALGWIRVTKANPCFFCAMIASRGLRTWRDDSFDESDARFEGPGTAKVHDSCACTLKPVYTKDDEMLGDLKRFEDMWREWGAGGGNAALRFRQGYEGRPITA